MILSTPEGFVYDMRAVSQVYESSEGEWVVEIASDVDYYRWMLLQVSPQPTIYPTHLVWVE